MEGWSGEIAVADTEAIKSVNPVEIDVGTDVAKMADRAFAGFTSLKRIDVPNTVTEIGDYAFKDSGLVEVSIPDSVTKIGKGAFMNCRSLTHVVLP